jgi:hypothetical protein
MGNSWKRTMKTITVKISERYMRGKFNRYKKFIYGR